MIDLRNLSGVKVGDTLYDPGISRYGRAEPNPREYYVVKVARKFLYASPEKNITGLKSWVVKKIYIENGCSADVNRSTVFKSKEVYEEILYRDEISKKIRIHFGSHNVRVPEITTDKLKEIAAILGIEE